MTPVKVSWSEKKGKGLLTTTRTTPRLLLANPDDAPEVGPAFPGPNEKRDAISYTRILIGGSRGEIHVYHDTPENIENLPAIIDSAWRWHQKFPNGYGD